MEIELTLRDMPPGLRMGGVYRLEPVLEQGDLMGYEVWNAATGAFIMFVTDDEVKVSKP